MIDPESEELISASKAARLPEYRRDGRAAHVSTVIRHMLASRLESVVVGGRRFTTRAAVRRMVAKQNPQLLLGAVTPAQREKEIAAAEKRVTAKGV